ncbi:iron sulfur assembly protein 1 [Stemphylium lycopersici]|nr:iron sulfur assembly protein 1 [Stemphylium lycopersici]
MSLPRTTGALARSSSSFLRFAAPSFAPRRCPQCSRAFASSSPHRQSAKRQMQTATAYRPHSLYPELPPRNAGVPDTSIAGGATETRNATSPQLPPQEHVAATQTEQPMTSIPEGEAQKTQQQAASPSKPLRPRRYNFGPRKATIKLSPSAVSHLRELLELPEPKLIRIGTKAKGCSGLAYHLEYVDKPSPLDEQVEQDGVKVLIDNKALLNIIGSEMDWLEDKLNERFIFKNPNINIVVSVLLAFELHDKPVGRVTLLTVSKC